MEIENYISQQPLERQKMLSVFHAAILKNDKSVMAIIKPMMGKEMILYNCKGTMKYGLSGVKNYVSLHAMPIYGSKKLHQKYQALLPDVKFQKGCINFNTEQEMPLAVFKQLIKDCAAIDLQKMIEDLRKSKK